MSGGGLQWCGVRTNMCYPAGHGAIGKLRSSSALVVEEGAGGVREAGWLLLRGSPGGMKRY